MTHLFLAMEYRMPGFPEDPNGLPGQDRTQYAKITLDYLLHDAGISFLSERKFPSGLRLFTDRELKHLEDVKNLVQPMLWVGRSTWIILLLTGIGVCRGRWRFDFFRSLRLGGWVAVGLAALIMIFVLIGFRNFFVFLHVLLFSENSWRFHPNNTLVRLFPIRFWRDVFVILAVFTMSGGLVFELGLRKKTSEKR